MTIRAFGGKAPTIGEGAFVAPSADVIGDVVIGPLSSIWYGTVLRGDVQSIRIGASKTRRTRYIKLLAPLADDQARRSAGDVVRLLHAAVGLHHGGGGEVIRDELLERSRPGRCGRG